MPCTACTARLPQNMFTPTQISNHFTKGTPVVCLQCSSRGCSARRPELYTCAGPCNKLLGGAAYAPRALTRKKKDKTHSIVCNSCKKNEAARVRTRLQQLRQLMETSKRRKCICTAVKPHTHVRRCPMHMTFAGEIIYPGCDVMTAEDSAWLRKRDKRY